MVPVPAASTNSSARRKQSALETTRAQFRFVLVLFVSFESPPPHRWMRMRLNKHNFQNFQLHLPKTWRSLPLFCSGRGSSFQWSEGGAESQDSVSVTCPLHNFTPNGPGVLSPKPGFLITGALEVPSHLKIFIYCGHSLFHCQRFFAAPPPRRLVEKQLSF